MGEPQMVELLPLNVWHARSSARASKTLPRGTRETVSVDRDLGRMIARLAAHYDLIADDVFALAPKFVAWVTAEYGRVLAAELEAYNRAHGEDATPPPPPRKRGGDSARS